jgi:hypothetical protein
MEYLEAELGGLQDALYRRAVLEASNDGCAELLSRGHPVFRVSIPSDNRSGTRDGWAVRGPGRGAGLPSEDAVTARARERPR